MTQPVEPTPSDFATLRRYIETREADQQQITHLSNATERLSDEVSGLQKALTMFATKGDVTKATEETQGEIDKAREKHLEELVALRLRIRKRTNRAFALTVVLLLLASGLLGYYTLSSHNTIHRLCQQRNAQSIDTAAKTRAYFGPKYAAEKNNPNADPVLLTILQSLATTQPKTVRC